MNANIRITNKSKAKKNLTVYKVYTNIFKIVFSNLNQLSEK